MSRPVEKSKSSIDEGIKYLKQLTEKENSKPGVGERRWHFFVPGKIVTDKDIARRNARKDICKNSIDQFTSLKKIIDSPGATQQQLVEKFESIFNSLAKLQNGEHSDLALDILKSVYSKIPIHELANQKDDSVEMAELQTSNSP